MIALALAALVSASPGALAATAQVYDRPSYQYLQISSGSADYSVGDAQEFNLEASWDLGDGYFAFADYSQARVDINGQGYDRSAALIGLGTHGEPAENVDLYGTLAFADAEQNTPFPGMGGPSVSGDGIVFGLGVRAMAGPRLELAGKVDYFDVADGGEAILELEALVKATDRIAIGLSHRKGERAEAFTIGLRVYL
ncbi:MAG: hypothetical protein QF724_01870 [Planctomycetota bacterium]|nr:hypothetical protein [Planctomycetota bacterium]